MDICIIMYDVVRQIDMTFKYKWTALYGVEYTRRVYWWRIGMPDNSAPVFTRSLWQEKKLSVHYVNRCHWNGLLFITLSHTQASCYRAAVTRRNCIIRCQNNKAHFALVLSLNATSKHVACCIHIRSFVIANSLMSSVVLISNSVVSVHLGRCSLISLIMWDVCRFYDINE